MQSASHNRAFKQSGLCRKCQGKKTVMMTKAGKPVEMECPVCQGSGKNRLATK